MRLLVDSHVFLWWAEDPGKLAEPARAAIEDGRNDAFVSLASIWELSIKIGLGKLELPMSMEEMMRRSLMSLLPIRLEHAIAAGSLPHHHRDPFDRMVVAQGLAEGMMVITRDEVLSRYGVPVMLA